jgi:hypothetical protein
MQKPNVIITKENSKTYIAKPTKCGKYIFEMIIEHCNGEIISTKMRLSKNNLGSSE